MDLVNQFCNATIINAFGILKKNEVLHLQKLEEKEDYSNKVFLKGAIVANSLLGKTITVSFLDYCKLSRDIRKEVKVRFLDKNKDLTNHLDILDYQYHSLDNIDCTKEQLLLNALDYFDGVEITDIEEF